MKRILNNKHQYKIKSHILLIVINQIGMNKDDVRNFQQLLEVEIVLEIENFPYRVDSVF